MSRNNDYGFAFFLILVAMVSSCCTLDRIDYKLGNIIEEQGKECNK